MTELLGLREALGLVRASSASESESPPTPFRVGIACSFTPLHLETFIAAYLSLRRPDNPVTTRTGIYGDLPGTLDQLSAADLDACITIIEWPDLDPRLGGREAVGAPIAESDDIFATAQQRVQRIATRVTALAARCPTAIVLPTLDVPPVYGGNRGRLGALRARLNLVIAEFAAQLSDQPGVRLIPAEAISAQDGASASPRDLRSDIRSGFPYTVAHASAVARAAVDALVPAATKKGLITDLDDTLWRGLVGEIGPEAVAWDLDSGALGHAMYQQLLAQLAKRGVLLAIASKNDPEVVGQALRREDLLVATDAIFPIAASWNAKSGAVSEILKAWNIGAGDVVFVDDSPTELAEVAAKHPEITTIPFPASDANAIATLLEQLTELFWREQVNPEDSLRLASLRSGAELHQAAQDAEDQGTFLRTLDGRITIRGGESWRQPRSRELVNKTNQFNLNGRRFDEVQWRELCTRPGALCWAISYEDRFGQLGVISVLAGIVEGNEVKLDCWVMSCRAFSRAIEHHLLLALCRSTGAERISFELSPTERNGILSSWVQQIAGPGEQGLPTVDCRTLRDDELADIHVVHQDDAGA